MIENVDKYQIVIIDSVTTRPRLKHKNANGFGNENNLSVFSATVSAAV